MDLLEKLIQIGRQHYEKILLTLTLLGLGVAVWFLTTTRQRENEKIDEISLNMTGRSSKAFTNEGLSRFEAAIALVEKPPALDLSMPHHLFNPVRWQRKGDGQLIKIESADDVGVAQLKVTKVTPLYFRIVLARVMSEGSYYLTVTDEAAVPRPKRYNVYLTLEKRREDIFVLMEVKGTEENPELVLEMTSNQERVTVSRDKPVEQVVSYVVDLRYELEGTNWPNRREGDVIRVSGEEYKIVAISEEEVVLSAVQNNKKYTIKITAG